jgi:hypothetical protein
MLGHLLVGMRGIWEMVEAGHEKMEVHQERMEANMEACQEVTKAYPEAMEACLEVTEAKAEVYPEKPGHRGALSMGTKCKIHAPSHHTAGLGFQRSTWKS